MSEVLTSFLTRDEIAKIGLKSFGENVRISRHAQFYGAENITIGNHVRIDDFTILSGNITLHNYIHIAAGTYLYGGTHGIEMKDFSSVSSHCSVYAKTVKSSQGFLLNAAVPSELRKLVNGKVVFEKHASVGAHSVILPNVILGEGGVVGAMSFIRRSTEPWSLYFGSPAKRIRSRDKNVLDTEAVLMAALDS